MLQQMIPLTSLMRMICDPFCTGNWTKHPFTARALNLEQLELGVAIGSFLSRREVEMWSTWKESCSLKHNRNNTVKRWHVKYIQLTETEPVNPPAPSSPASLSPPASSACAPSSHPPPLPANSLSLMALTPYVQHAYAPLVVDIQQMRRRKQAASLTPEIVKSEGMPAWWQPLDTIWGFFDVGDTILPTLSLLPFDGDWEG